MANWTPTPGYFPVAGWGGNPPPEPCECGGSDFTYQRSAAAFGQGTLQFGAASIAGSNVICFMGSIGIPGEVTYAGAPWTLEEDIQGPGGQTLRAYSRPGDGTYCPVSFTDNEYGNSYMFIVMLEFESGTFNIWSGGDSTVSGTSVGWQAPNIGGVISKMFGFFYGRNAVSAEAALLPAGSTLLFNDVIAGTMSGVMIDGSAQQEVSNPVISYEASAANPSNCATITCTVQSPI